MFHIVLHEPKIAPNTGNVLRLVANNGCTLHLIEPLGFDFEEKKLRRAGLDYGDIEHVGRYPNYAAFKTQFAEAFSAKRVFAVTTKGSVAHDAPTYQRGDILVFGSETAGLPETILTTFDEKNRVRIPMRPNSRSLNLSNAVSVVSYEAWRQLGFYGSI